MPNLRNLQDQFVVAGYFLTEGTYGRQPSLIMTAPNRVLHAMEGAVDTLQ
jgi:hypothetical protein